MLALRPWLLPTAHRSAWTLALFGLLAACGLLWPVPRPSPAVGIPLVAAAAIGVGAFVAGRLAGGGTPPLPHTASYTLLAVVAAGAEEAFFRRFLYGALAHRGPIVAVCGSAVAFTAVHLTIYGGWAMPLDLAAGLVLSWQRHATGSWRLPAATHALGNLLVVLT